MRELGKMFGNIKDEEIATAERQLQEIRNLNQMM